MILIKFVKSEENNATQIMLQAHSSSAPTQDSMAKKKFKMNRPNHKYQSTGRMSKNYGRKNIL